MRRFLSSQAKASAPSKKPRLDGQVALITGATRGIGLALTERLAARGCAVGLLARDPRRGEQVTARLNASSPPARGKGDDASGTWQHSFFACDLDDLSANAVRLDEVSGDVLARFGGRVDLLVHCAGVSMDSLLVRAKFRDVHAMFTVNVVAPVLLTQKVLHGAMLRQQRGRVLFVGSQAAHKARAGNSVYAATKAALEGFTRALSVELQARKEIAVSCVAPGFVDTDMARGYEDVAKLSVERVVDVMEDVLTAAPDSVDGKIVRVEE